MRKLFLAIAFILPLAASAQETASLPDVTLELETSTNMNFVEDEFEQMDFKVNRMRFGVQGGLGDNLSYHFRTTFHKNSDVFSVDNMARSIELAKISWTPNEKWDFSAGKMFVVHGGYENYVNVLLVREFTDFNSCIEVYQTGVQGTYHASDDHQFTLQIVNNRAESDSQLYAAGLPEGIRSAKIPMMGTFNWDGFFADRAVRMMYSTSISQVAQDKYMYYFTAGNIYEKGPVLAYFDIMYSRSQVDKAQRISSRTSLAPTAQNVEYLTLIADFEYQFTPNWNAYVKGAYETSNIYKDNGIYKKGHYLTSWNAQACVEWFPFTKDKGLKVYLHYVYKGNEVENSLMTVLPDTQRVSLGLTYSIPVL